MFSIIPQAISLIGRCVLPQFLFSEIEEKPRLVPGNIATLETGDTHYMLREPDVPIEKRQSLVVLLHGASVYSFIWDHFVNSFLSRGHPVLVFDFYGHGYSEHKPETFKFSIEFFCQQMEHLLQHLRISGPFVLIGHSMGGLVASNFTSRHKEMVSKLVLLNCAGIAIPKSFKNILPSSLGFMQDIIRNTTCLDRMVHFVAGLLSIHGNHTNVTHDQLTQLALTLDEEKSIVVDSSSVAHFSYDRVIQLLPSEAARFAKSMSFLYYAWIHQCAISNRSQVLLDILRGCLLLDGDYTKVFSSIDIPTLIIWGESDALLPKSMASDMRTFMPHAEILYLNGDHAAFLQKPAQTFQSIVNFVEFNSSSGSENVI